MNKEQYPGEPASANVRLGEEQHDPFRALEFEPAAQNQIFGELAQFEMLEGRELEYALAERFLQLKRAGELAGKEELSEWAAADGYQHEGGLVLKAMPGVELMSDAERYRVCLAQTIWASYVLGSPWSRPYENDGRLTQDVMPKPGSEMVVGSIGMTEQDPHNEVLPDAAGEIIASEYSILSGVHNLSPNYPSAPTTVFDAQKAIQRLTQEEIAILADPQRFQWNGTAIEQAGTGEHERQRIPVLTPVRDAAGKVLAYDLLADLDGVTMQAVAGDQAAADALAVFKREAKKEEIDYVIQEGYMFVWRNRRVLHGRKQVWDPERHLVRSQIGEAHYADHDLAV